MRETNQNKGEKEMINSNINTKSWITVTATRINNYRDKAVRISITNSFEIKDTLKSLGYRYDNIDKTWCKSIVVNEFGSLKKLNDNEKTELINELKNLNNIDGELFLNNVMGLSGDYFINKFIH